MDALRQSGIDMNIGGSSGGAQGAASADEGGDDSAADDRQGGRHAGSGGGKPPMPHVEIPFMDKMASWGKRAIIVAIIVILIVALIAYWWFHPPINIHSVDTWTFVAIFILLPLFLFFRVKSKNYADGTKKVAKSEGKAKTFRILSYLPVAVVVVGLLGAVASFSFFPGNAAKYSSILQTENHDFAEDIQEVNYSEIPIIDRDVAERLGDKELGSISEYVSQFSIDPLYSQINYQGSPVRVSPLGYADLFKWLTNRDQGLPAYSLVNMTTQDAEIIRLPEGEGVKYSQSEPLARNIDRYVQLKYPFYMFEEKSFEIDEDGHPWWICPVQTRTIGLFGGTTISRVVLCDAVTGECQDLSIEECPQWVDRAYPADLLIQQYNWYGSYQNGWFNSWLGQQGVVQTTPGLDGQQGYNYIAKDDDVWVYTGVTSATADSSIVGFVLVNQRTQESHFYQIAGATEASAMSSAEGAVQNLRYTATFPILINVAGQPTYFMSLKDNEGTVKKFAMVDIQRYQNVAVGDTVADTQKSYVQLMATNGVDLSQASDPESLKSATGVISHMAQAVIEGNSHFYVKLDGSSNIYDFALPGLLDIVGYKEGDTITFSYIDSEGTYVVESITVPGASADNPPEGSSLSVTGGSDKADQSSSSSESSTQKAS